MGRAAILLLVLLGLACKGPEAAPVPKTPAHLTVHFLDQDAVVGLDRPLPGAWAVMDAGMWRDLDTIWTGLEGRAAVGRTAPRWVMLQDPEGGIHRVELSNAPDTVRSEPYDREDAEDQATGLFLLWLWFSHVVVDHH
ncbi:MAG TPA: hypothetical protein VFT46_00895 [Holophagaceae bacterium]|nr:hypothetical protein [Holophagaceae bacterium]